MEVRAGYKQTELGVIPKDWSVKPLLSVIHVVTGQVDPRREPYKSMILVAPDHIESASGHLNSKQTAVEQHAISGKFQFKSGDIVYSKIRPYLRKAFLADFEGICSADMYPLTPASNVSARFMLAILLGHDFSTFAEAVSVRSGFPKINRTELAEYRFALPPPAEQRAIATALSDADVLITSLGNLIAKKRNIKQAAMQELLTGKRRLPGFNGDWELKRLGDLISDIADGGTPSTSRTEHFGGCINWIVIEDINDEIFSTEQTLTEEGLSHSSARIWPPGSIILSTGATIGEVGITKVHSATKQGICGIIVNQSADSIFLKYWFKQNKPLLLAKAQGSSIKEVRPPTLVKLELNVPVIDEQRAIATVLSDMDAELTAMEQKRDKTKAIKQGMMQELLTGRIRLV